MDAASNTTAASGCTSIAPVLDSMEVARLKQLTREISNLLNAMPVRQRVTIEPSATSAQPVLIEDLDRGIQPDDLTLMNRGLKMMESGAMRRDPRIAALGMIWDIEGARHETFCGVAVRYRVEQ